MRILEFRKIVTKDRYDDLYDDGSAWSRVYEYPLIMDTISEIHKAGQLIHNSSWGWQGVHVIFKEELEKSLKQLKIQTLKVQNYQIHFYMT